MAKIVCPICSSEMTRDIHFSIFWTIVQCITAVLYTFIGIPVSPMGTGAAISFEDKCPHCKKGA